MTDLFTTTAVFMEGATALGYACAALFFLRFWRRTGDRLFLLFAIALLIISGNTVVISLWDIPGERAYFYLPRLAAFLLLIWAVVDKNLAKGPATGGSPGPAAGGEAGPGGGDSDPGSR
jgi:hypothetical protein